MLDKYNKLMDTLYLKEYKRLIGEGIDFDVAETMAADYVDKFMKLSDAEKEILARGN